MDSGRLSSAAFVTLVKKVTRSWRCELGYSCRSRASLKELQVNDPSWHEQVIHPYQSISDSSKNSSNLWLTSSKIRFSAFLLVSLKVEVALRWIRPERWKERVSISSISKSGQVDSKYSMLMMICTICDRLVDSSFLSKMALICWISRLSTAYHNNRMNMLDQCVCCNAQFTFLRISSISPCVWEKPSANW